MTTKTTQKYNVFVNVTLPVSIEIETTSAEEALALGMDKLSNLTTKEVNLEAITIDREVINVKAEDFDFSDYEVIKDGVKVY